MGYTNSMTEIPEELLTTDKLLYLTSLSGESQAPLMKKLAQVAQELFEEYPQNFCALIPFWSRTRWLSEADSDFDIFLVLEDVEWHLLDKRNSAQTERIKKAFYDKMGDTWVKYQIKEKSRSHFEQSLLGRWTSEIDSNLAGAILGPHRLHTSLKKIRKSSDKIKKYTIEKLLQCLEKSEEKKKVGTKKFVSNRLRLWRKRLEKLLDYKE